MNLKNLGMIISVFIIVVMITITIKTNLVVENEAVGLEEYPSGLIEDQINENDSSDPDIGFEKGDVAADFELKNLSGEIVRLSDYRGKKVFLNFWVSWCGPCRVEMPHMENYYKEYKDSGDVEIIAVNMTTSERKIEMVQEFVDSRELTFPVLLDNEGEVESLYKVIGYPTTYLINEKGIIVDGFTAAVDEKRIKELIDNIK